MKKGGENLATINSTEVIANSKFNRFHLGLLVWSFIIILFDGYDLVVYGTVVPTLIEKWNLSSVEAGAIGTYGLFGMMFGAIFFGTLADRIGRKNVIAITLVLFSLFTFLCGFAETPTIFSTFRFLAGLGLGGIMPNVIALLTDYAPKTMRSMIVSHRIMRLFDWGNPCSVTRNLFNANIRLGIDLLVCGYTSIIFAFYV